MTGSERTTRQVVRRQTQEEPADPSVTIQTRYKFRLFIAGNRPNSILAKRNIKEICLSHLSNSCELELIDVFEDFSAAIDEQIVVAPVLIVDQPIRAKIIGNLQDKAKVLAVLGLT
jgi:circadian clock protein KaiB